MSFAHYTEAIRGGEIARLLIHRAADESDPAASVLEALLELDAAGFLARPAFAREIGAALAIRLALPEGSQP